MSEQPKKARAKKGAVVQQKRAVCKGHHQLHMCFNCKDEHCKEQGFYKMHRCKNLFFWIASMVSIVIAFVVLTSIFIIARLIDGNWTNPALPLALLTGLIAYTVVVLAIGAIVDFKHRTGDAIYE